MLGGIYATLCHGHAGMHSDADYILAGPAERTLPRLLKDLWDETCAFDLPGRFGDTRPLPCLDLETRPTCAPIMASRGCPFRCTYCAVPALSGPFTRRSTAAVVAEIAGRRDELGIRDFAFYDDALLAGGTGLLAALPPLGVHFHCPNALHAKWITPEIARLLREGGFKTIRIGLETADPAVQEHTGGKVTCAAFAAAAENLRAAGYTRDDVGTYILCGLPRQAAEDVARSIHYVRQAGARPVLAEYSPIPKTALWPEAVAGSRYPLADEPLTHNNTILPCRWEGFTCDDYIALRKQCRE